MPKFRIYIDEVGNADLASSKNPNHRYLSLTGVIFNLEFIRTTLFSQVELIKSRYFNSHPDNPVILHRKEIINKKHPFKALLNPKVEAAFSKDLLKHFTDWEYTVISVVIDKLEHHKRYTVWKFDPYHYCLEIILERYHRFLLDKQAVGDVMVEARGKREDQRLKKSFNKLYEEGTSYISAQMLQQTFTSSQLKLKLKSANLSGLQVADLLAFPARRYILKYYGKLQDDRETFNERIIEILKTKFYRRGQKIEGYGFKLLP